MDKVQEKLGFTTASVLSYHSSLIDVASAALGGKKAEPKTGLGPGVNDLGNAPSFEAAVASINGILKFG